MEQKMSDQLVRRLSRGGLDEELVRELVDVVSDVGLTRLKGFPIGIIDPDGIMIRATADPDQLQGLFKVLTRTPRLDAVRLFPKGIINPEIFEIELELR